MWVMWVLLGAAAFVVLVLPRLQMSSIEPAQLKALLDGGALLVDVRTAGEFAGGSVPGAINLPVGSVATAIGAHASDTSTPVILFCASGARSASAASQLRGIGYSTVINLGGLGRARSLVEAARSAP